MFTKIRNFWASEAGNVLSDWILIVASLMVLMIIAIGWVSFQA